MTASSSFSGIHPLSQKWLGSEEKPQLHEVQTKSTLAIQREQLNFTFTFPGVEATEVETEIGSFTRLSSLDTGTTRQSGSLELPVFRKVLYFEPGRTYSCSATVESSVQFDLSAEGMPPSLLCTQRPVPKIPGALEAAQTSFDANAYVAPEQPIASLTEIGIVGEQSVWLLEINPVACDATTGTILLRKEMGIAIEADDLQSIASSQLDTKSAATAGRLLIVAPDAYLALLEPFAAHKRNMGWLVDIAPTSAAGSTAVAIQNHIQIRYGENDSKPTHLLLAGDTDTIPAWTGNGAYLPDTDLYYACMDGIDDWLPDMAYGRLPARTESQLSNMLTRIIHYETNTTANQPIVSNAVFAASSDNYAITEGSHDSVINMHMAPRSYQSDKVYSYTYDATGADIITDVNWGCGLVTYSGHAYYNKWVDPLVSISAIHSLSNGWANPFVASFACDSGSYAAHEECLAEAWLRTAADSGGIAVWASSEDSYWNEDDVLEKGLYASIFLDGNRMLGDIVSKAKERYLAHYGTSSETLQYFEQYTLFGDPTMKLVALNGTSTGDSIAAQRSFDKACVQSNGLLTVTVNLDVPGSVPSALILKEILPSGWSVMNARWNGSPMAPSLIGDEYKWLFGFGIPVGSGTLTYQTQATGVLGSVYVLTGQLLYDVVTLQTTGDQQIRFCFFIDSDEDGMPDDWELAYGLNPASANDASGHSDSDSFDNLSEFIAGTDPTNAASCFEVSCTDADVNGTNCFVVEWRSIPDRIYSIHCSTNLVSGFQSQEDFIEYPQNSYTDTVHEAVANGFFRVDARMK